MFCIFVYIYVNENMHLHILKYLNIPAALKGGGSLICMIWAYLFKLYPTDLKEHMHAYGFFSG